MRKRIEFFGREDLIAQLDNLWAKRVSSLVTCRGRRRVGKSTLIGGPVRGTFTAKNAGLIFVVR